MLDKKITDAVYEFIYQYREANSVTPTYKKIATELRLKPSAVERHLVELERLNKIYREENGRPAIRLVNGNNGHG